MVDQVQMTSKSWLKLALKADELYVNVVQDLHGVEAIQQYRAFILSWCKKCM